MAAAKIEQQPTQLWVPRAFLQTFQETCQTIKPIYIIPASKVEGTGQGASVPVSLISRRIFFIERAHSLQSAPTETYNGGLRKLRIPIKRSSVAMERLCSLKVAFGNWSSYRIFFGGLHCNILK